MSKENTIHVGTFYQNLIQKHPLQYEHQFTIEFIAPAGETGSTFDDTAFGRPDSSDVECFTYWGQSATLPELKVSEAKVNFMANGFSIPGVIDYGGGEWNVKLLLDQDLTQYKKLQAWQTLISDMSKSGGGRKIIPNVQAKLNLLDNTMSKVKRTFILEGIWISKLGDVSFKPEEGGTSKAECTATFIYQYFYNADDLENPTASDPLSPGVVDTIAKIQNVVVG